MADRKNQYRMLGLIFSIEVGLAFLFTQNLELSEYLIPITVAAMVLTIMFDVIVELQNIDSKLQDISELLGDLPIKVEELNLYLVSNNGAPLNLSTKIPSGVFLKISYSLQNLASVPSLKATL